jgi:ECF sigma factor
VRPAVVWAEGRRGDRAATAVCMSETSALTDTGLLQAVERGDAAALTALFSLACGELSILAHQQRRRWHGEITLGTAALVHEVYLKMAGPNQPGQALAGQLQPAHGFGVKCG